MNKNPKLEPINYFSRGIDTWSDLTGYISGLAIFAASVVIVYMVIARKLLGMSTSWEDELSRYLLILATFIGAAFTQKLTGSPDGRYESILFRTSFEHKAVAAERVILTQESHQWRVVDYRVY